MFDSKKKLKLASGETIDKKLSRHQIISVDFNQCLLSYYTNQVSEITDIFSCQYFYAYTCLSLIYKINEHDSIVQI